VPHDPTTYRDLAERSWAWVQAQVRSTDDGLWLPANPSETEPGEDPFGMHSGIGGLAHVLAEIRLTRELTADEQRLADRIADTVVRRIPEESEFDYFVGLVATIGVLTALGADGADQAVGRLRELATADGWRPPWMEEHRFPADGRCNDATIGNSSVLLGALLALRYDVPGAAELASLAVDVVLAEKEETPHGLDWMFVPRRYWTEPRGQMPNWSHGLAGIAGTLAAAGTALDRPDLIEAARLGSEHLVTLADTSDGGMRLAHVIPDQEGLDTYTYTWCHGPPGTSLLFSALDRAGVTEVAGRTPYDWERACLHSLKVSGIPERRHPGFWDNDGRCCGTAGVGDVVLNIWQRGGEDDDLAFALTLADAIVDRAITETNGNGTNGGETNGEHVYWRFVEHRNEDPLLPPGVGYMQGSAGISAYLFRVARVLEQGRDAAAVARMDTWWALPDQGSAGPGVADT
jgi:Lanthionine synthetase C-like protein